jgi:hypothetical protein
VPPSITYSVPVMEAIELGAEDLLGRPTQHDRPGSGLGLREQDDPLLQSDLLTAKAPELTQPHESERRKRRNLLNG